MLGSQWDCNILKLISKIGGGGGGCTTLTCLGSDYGISEFDVVMGARTFELHACVTHQWPEHGSSTLKRSRQGRRDQKVGQQSAASRDVAMLKPVSKCLQAATEIVCG